MEEGEEREKGGREEVGREGRRERERVGERGTGVGSGRQFPPGSLSQVLRKRI